MINLLQAVNNIDWVALGVSPNQIAGAGLLAYIVTSVLNEFDVRVLVDIRKGHFGLGVTIRRKGGASHE
jgi:hypothetical protein